QVKIHERNKKCNLTQGAGVVVICSALAGNEGSASEMTIASQEPERLEITGATPLSAVGSPVVNRDGEVVAVVTSAGEGTIARPSAALDSLLSRVTDDTEPSWASTAETRATPRPTPQPRLI